MYLVYKKGPSTVFSIKNEPTSITGEGYIMVWNEEGSIYSRSRIPSGKIPFLTLIPFLETDVHCQMNITAYEYKSTYLLLNKTKS